MQTLSKLPVGGEWIFDCCEILDGLLRQFLSSHHEVVGAAPSERSVATPKHCFAPLGAAESAHREVGSKAEVAAAIGDWLEGNSNAQACFIGTHGIVDSSSDEVLWLGPVGEAGNFAPWAEVWQWFEANPRLEGGLWLGACYSSAAASAFSELWQKSTQLLVPYIFGFSDAIEAKDIEWILLKLIEFSGLDSDSDLDSQLEILRASVPGTKIELFYPASDRNHRYRYINVDVFQNEVGCLFSQHLDNNNKHYQRRAAR